MGASQAVRDRIVGGTLEAEGPVRNVGRMSESLRLKCDDLAAARELREYVAERRLDGVATAVKQHKRRMH